MSAPEFNNAVKVVVEQTENGATLSRVTLEYPALENWVGNEINLSLIEGMLAAAREMAATKKSLSTP